MPERALVYVGTYSEPILFGTRQVLQGKGRGIHAFRLDPVTGALEPCGITEGVRNASYLAFGPSRRFLYCVNELKELDGVASGGVSAFAVDGTTGRLTFLNRKPSHGTDPCHLIVDATGSHVLLANFASGSVCVLPILGDGSLGDASAVVQHQGSSVDPRRQAGPHAHAVAIDQANRYVFVPDLGLDKVMIYRFDAQQGTLKANEHQPFVAVAAGAGPRQLVMHPNGTLAFLINELSSTITSYSYDPDHGRLEELHTVSTLPRGFAGHSTCAEVQITPSGAYLYGSNRGHDSLVIHAVDAATGGLRLVGHESTRGSIPRHFEVGPTGAILAVANQDSGSVVTFRIDPGSGTLAATGHIVDVGTPICVRFM